MAAEDAYVERLIEYLGLEPLPIEGGLYRRSYRSPEELPEECLPTGCRGGHPMGSAIFYLYTAEPDSFSALHVLPSDEIYHFYLGDPVELLLLGAEGKAEHAILGQDLLGGQSVQRVVPRGVWQGSRLAPGGRFALIGTTMAPGFSDADYRGGGHEELLRLYPGEKETVLALTRESR